MEFGLLVLGFVVLFDIVLMVFVMRVVLSEPPHKRPTPHPLALEYAAASAESAGDSDAAESAEAEEEADETLPVSVDVEAADEDGEESKD